MWTPINTILFLELNYSKDYNDFIVSNDKSYKKIIKILLDTFKMFV